MRHFTFIISAFVVSAMLMGCSNKEEDPSYSVETDVSEENPFAAYAGDWMTEAFAMEGDEPLVVLLFKATDSAEGWSWKFTHLEDPVMASSVEAVGDTVVTVVGPYMSALRDGETVESVTSYVHVEGDSMNGRFRAVYENGDVLDGLLMGDRIE